MKIRTAAITVSVLMILLSTGAFGQVRRPLMREHRLQSDMKTPHTRFLTAVEANREELKITDEQLEKVRSLMDSNRENSIKMEADLRLIRLELGRLMRRDQKKDYAEIESRMEAASTVRRNMMIERMKNRDAIMEVFTPEQHEAMKILFNQRREQRAPLMRRDRLPRRFPGRDFRNFRRDPWKPRMPDEPSVLF